MADFELRHLNMAYMTMFARSSNSASEWWRIWNEFKTISKILKMVFAEENNSEDIVVNQESDFLNDLEVRSDNCS
jgi:hypothetical protein